MFIVVDNYKKYFNKNGTISIKKLTSLLKELDDERYIGSTIVITSLYTKIKNKNKEDFYLKLRKVKTKDAKSNELVRVLFNEPDDEKPRLLRFYLNEISTLSYNGNIEVISKLSCIDYCINKIIELLDTMPNHLIFGWINSSDIWNSITMSKSRIEINNKYSLINDFNFTGLETEDAIEKLGIYKDVKDYRIRISNYHDTIRHYIKNNKVDSELIKNYPLHLLINKFIKYTNRIYYNSLKYELDDYRRDRFRLSSKKELELNDDGFLNAIKDLFIKETNRDIDEELKKISDKDKYELDENGDQKFSPKNTLINMYNMEKNREFDVYDFMLKHYIETENRIREIISDSKKL